MVSPQNADVASGWCLVIPASEAHRASPLRHRHDVEACVVDEKLWIRGEFVPQNVQELLRLVPGSQVFLLVPSELSSGGAALQPARDLVPLGKRVPCGRLPEATWRPLSEHVRLEFPATISAIAKVTDTVPLKIVRGGIEQSVNLILVELGAWADYVASVPAWRLERWSFAVSENRSVLVRGVPIPAMPGQRWVERDGIATPAGWTWQPPVSTAVLRRRFGLEAGQIVLLGATGSWQLIRPSDWVQASRSAVRLTVEAQDGRA